MTLSNKGLKPLVIELWQILLVFRTGGEDTPHVGGVHGGWLGRDEFWTRWEDSGDVMEHVPPSAEVCRASTASHESPLAV